MTRSNGSTASQVSDRSRTHSSAPAPAPDAGAHATAGEMLAQLKDKVRAAEACEKLLGADPLQTTEARTLFARVRRADERDTHELQELLGKLHVSGHGPAASGVTRAAAADKSRATPSPSEEAERGTEAERNAASRTRE